MTLLKLLVAGSSEIATANAVVLILVLVIMFCQS